MKIIDGTLACVDIILRVLRLACARYQQQEQEQYVLPQLFHSIQCLFLLNTGVPETSGSAICCAKFVTLAPFNLLVACNDHLGNALAVGYCEGLI